MNTKTIQFFLALMVGLALSAILPGAYGQKPDADTTVSESEKPEQRGERRHFEVHVKDDRNGRDERMDRNGRGRDGRDDRQGRDGRERHVERYHYSPEAFRQFIKAELEFLPSLNSRMQRLMNIQAERQELQKKRQEVASRPDQDRKSTIENFHALLRRDQELSEESRKIAREIVKDLPQIEKQLNGRRENLSKELEKVYAADDDPSSASAARDVRRKIRYVEFLDKKLSDLKTRPERLDLLTRILRGGPYDDLNGDGRLAPLPKDPKEHLEDLRGRKRELQKELQRINNEIELLQEGGSK